MPELIEPRNLLLAIRETGYRSFAHTLAELIDNSIQANSSDISIDITGVDGGRIIVVDNGEGMTVDGLRVALQFGGSSRFNDRRGLGRFGMGLPTSSLSISRRVDVSFTWQTQESVRHVVLDLDALHDSKRIKLPEPKTVTPRRCFRDEPRNCRSTYSL